MRFVILGDLHYSVYATKNLRAVREEFYERLFRSVKHTNPDVIFAIGDVSHSSRAEELEGLRECARRAGVDHYYMVNGNHDMTRLTRAEIAKYNYNPRPGYYDLNFDENGKLVPPEQAAWRFLVLDTSQEGKKLDTGGFVDHSQLEWLARHLAYEPDTPLFVLGHHPLRGLTRWSKLPGMSINNSEAVWRVMSRKTKGLGFYFCGHNHSNSEAQRDNWLAVQTAAPLNTFNFRLVDVTPRGIELHLVEMEGGAETARLGNMLSLAQYSITRIYGRRAPTTHREPMRVHFE